MRESDINEGMTVLGDGKVFDSQTKLDSRETGTAPRKIDTKRWDGFSDVRKCAEAGRTLQKKRERDEGEQKGFNLLQVEAGMGSVKDPKDHVG